MYFSQIIGKDNTIRDTLPHTAAKKTDAVLTAYLE
jgi:hypothetical protein